MIERVEVIRGGGSSRYGSNAIAGIGLRFDYYKIEENSQNGGDISGNVFSPRLSFVYNFTDHLQFRTGFASGFRSPQIFDEDLHIDTSGSRKVTYKNDPDLKQESSVSFTASLDYSNHLGHWECQVLVEGFYTSLTDPFANEYGEPDENGTIIYTPKCQGWSKSAG